MDFSKKLNEYMEILDCSGKELSVASSIKPPIISGYKNGSRIPKYNSNNFDNLIKGLLIISKEKKVNLNESIIRNTLGNCLKKDNIDFDIFKNNFNTLISTLKINVSDLSKYIGFDSSFLSKVKSGIRKPSNIGEFANKVCKFIINNYQDSNDLLKNLIKNDINHENLYMWLTNNKDLNENFNIDSFVKKLDNFDLNNYIKAIKFDKLLTPTLPKIITKSKYYYGFDGYKEAQLEVLKQSAFFKNKSDIFWYSNMPMIEASKDLKFMKKYMMYLAFILKKGMKLNIVHNLDRPFSELMLGLEGWIPLYMTGQINPYYFKNNFNYLYSIIECVSDSAIMHGECITGNLDTSKILVSTKKDDINYYKENAKHLLKKASPLMYIYNIDKKDSFIKLNTNIMNGNRRNILLNIPIYTLSNELLDEILKNNNISESDCINIRNIINNEKKLINDLLITNKIIDEITIHSEKEFQNSKYLLDLSNYYIDLEIKYNYEEYLKHIELLKEFKSNNKNYDYKLNANIFKNINIYIIENKQVIISKINKPVTHFVIYHPTLIKAIQEFNPPINERDYVN